MAASCWAWREVPLDEVAVELAPAFVVVLALLLVCAYAHPENRPVPKMRARTSVRSRIAPAGPAPFPWGDRWRRGRLRWRAERLGCALLAGSVRDERRL